MTRGRLLWWSLTTGIALWCALMWSVVLIVAAFTLPAYSTATGTAVEEGSAAGGNTPIVTGTATVVEANGLGVLVSIGLPTVVTLLVAWALAARQRRIGWVLTSLFAAFNLLAMLSIGIFLLPVTLALIVACAATERRRVAHPADEVAPA